MKNDGEFTASSSSAPVFALVLVVEVMETLGTLVELVRSDGFADIERQRITPALDRVIGETGALFDTTSAVISTRARASRRAAGSAPS